jgi:hypothetical protein
MPIPYIIGVLLIVGLLLWVINQIPWIDAGIKKVIYIIVVVFVCLWLIGLLTGVTIPLFSNARIG